MIALFGCGAYLYAGMCGYGLWLTFSLADRHQQAALIRSLVVHGVIAVVIGTALLLIGWKLALGADMSDPDNPRKPMIRF